MTKIAELKKKLMRNPDFREYERADAEFQLIEALVSARMIAREAQP